MPLYDLPLKELERYRSPDAAPADFDRFWERSLEETARTAAQAPPPRFEPVEDPIYRAVRVWDVTFPGWLGQPVRGWLILPVESPVPAAGWPCIVSFVGYGGGRSLPVDHLAPAVAGFAHFVMDTRGQGSVWSPGDTVDDAPAGPQYPGFMTRGIESPETYYYRRVFMDGVQAVTTAAEHAAVDAGRIAVTGGSQGGAISLAVAGLLREQIRLVMPDVPFLCHFRRAVTLVESFPYNEIALYLKTHRGRENQVFRTLDYFDGVNFAPRVTARALVSVALMDPITPPSTIYAAYNALKCEKELRVYPFNHHEGGGPFQIIERLRFATRNL